MKQDMSQITIAIGTDHHGFHLKELLKIELRKVNSTRIEWLDAGCFTAERTDYPPFAKAVCQTILDGKATRGVLLCGTGIGMSIAANRFSGIFAALVWNEDIARLAREHDHANILVLPANSLDIHQCKIMITAWLTATPLPGRYLDRISMIDQG